VSDTGVWAYAITEDGGATDLSWLTGVGGARVRTVACSGLTTLVSDVSLAEFGEGALRRNLEDLDWLDEVARAHHQVIDAAARQFPLLPTRLATVYTSDTAVRDALDERGAELRAVLRRVGGRVEWGVKAYAEPSPAREERVPAARDRVGAPEAADRDAGTGAGLAYLKRRRAQLTAGERARSAAVNAVRAVHANLGEHAADSRLHPPQSAQLSGAKLPMLLNAAYLIATDESASFTAAVAAEASAHPELRIERTGPWPPYSFAGDEQQPAGDGQRGPDLPDDGERGPDPAGDVGAPTGGDG
jgi:Gas vesicle synthesis protein GvpL/GvpF